MLEALLPHSLVDKAKGWFDEFMVSHANRTNIILLDFVEDQLDLAKQIINANN